MNVVGDDFDNDDGDQITMTWSDVDGFNRPTCSRVLICVLF